ncbi:hypothetical protein L6R50_15850 [Myxococcota bacterium]|nr:hypothetical protein [Myxococcota bacterium]
MIARDEALLPPRGSTEVRSGDHLFIVVDHESRRPVDAVFARRRGEERTFLRAEFPLRGSATIGDVAETYGIRIGDSPETTLEQFVRRRASDVAVNTTVATDGVRLRVRELSEGRILSIGLAHTEEV